MPGVKVLLALGTLLPDVSLGRPVVDAFASSTSAPTANIKNGTVVGSSNLALKAEAFLGIPYATAPVGIRKRSLQSSIQDRPLLTKPHFSLLTV